MIRPGVLLADCAFCLVSLVGAGLPIIAGSWTAPAAAACASTSTGTLVTGSTGQPETISGTATSNARIIIGVGKTVGVPQSGWIIAIATALQESGLENLSYGSGQSHGLFQQQAPGFGWGTVAQTEDPTFSAESFYERLLTVPGWESLPLTVAAQDVQQSAYPGAYARWQSEAEQIAAANSSAPSVTLPLPPNVWGPLHAGGSAGPGSVLTAADGCGGVTATGSAAVVLAAAERWLGTPYSWGAGDDNGPTLGIAQGTGTVGFDCSGLVMYAFWQGVHVQLPRTSQDQYEATRADSVPINQLQPGDLVFYEPSASGPGHVTIDVGNGDVIQAPETGQDVDIIPMSTVGLVGATRVLTSGSTS